MKKLLIIVLSCSELAMHGSFTKHCSSASQLKPIHCSPCAQALLNPNTLVPFNSHSHGAPTQSVATLCPELPQDYCDDKNLQLISVGGFAPECIDYPQSIRLFQLTNKNRLREIPLAFSDQGVPSEFIFSTAICCFNNIPFIVFAGAPNSIHEVLWIYRYNIIDDTYYKVCSWAFDSSETERCILSAAINCTPCIDSTTGEPFLQIAAVGQPDSLGNNAIMLFKFQEYNEQCSLSLVNEIPIESTLYKAVWCNFKNCPLLAVGGQSSQTDQCDLANLHLYHVNCNFSAIPAATPILVGDKTTKVRAIATCCDKKPFPFFAVVANTTINKKPMSIVKVYFYDPQGKFQELAVLPGNGTIAGENFAIAFDPGCNCQSITFAGGTCEPRCKCTKNIFTYNFKCKKPGQYPVIMKPIEKAFGSFDDTITDLAFCKRADGNCYDMIVTSESASWSPEKDPLGQCNHGKGEIGLFKVIFCPNHKRCDPDPICIRKNIPVDLLLD